MEEQMEEEEGEGTEDTSGPDYNYLLSMPMWFLTKEKKDELCKQRDAKVRCSAMQQSYWWFKLKIKNVTFKLVYPE